MSVRFLTSIFRMCLIAVIIAGLMSFEQTNISASSAPTVISTIKLGEGGYYPRALAVNPVTNRIYVLHMASDNVLVIDGATNNILSKVNVGRYPAAVAVNPRTNRIYVANIYSDTVSVIDGNNSTILATVNVGTTPVDVAVNSITNRIYVTNSIDKKV
jgi:YVTN family beta-propeller protein